LSPGFAVALRRSSGLFTWDGLTAITITYPDADAGAAVVDLAGGAKAAVALEAEGVLSGGRMKIAISSQGRTLTSMIDPRFGRTHYLIIYDTDNDSWQAVSNVEAGRLAHGAGIQTARNVISQKVDWVVSGNFGPKARQVLTAANIRVAQVPEGTVAEVVELAKQDRLAQAAAAGS
jgi:predicted Fe-Mo cluster-binding NifX family protein